MELIFRHFSKRIIVDVHPSRLIFSCSASDYYLPLPTFAYIGIGAARTWLLSLGEELSGSNLSDPRIVRVNLFEFDEPIPPESTLTRGALIRMLFEYGIGRAQGGSFVPMLRPLLFVTGVDRFQDRMANPRESFAHWATQAGAASVFFDQTDLE